MPATFSTVLIANRGEIACRILRSIHKMGFSSVCVYSDVDRDALHVRMADRSVWIGGSLVTDSYLCAEKIIHAAQKSNAQAIHPGYGFLSENPEFASLCQKAGLVFIGPSPQAMKAMANKAQAKKLAQNLGIPCVEGYQEQQNDEALLAAAQRLGFPVLIKAAAGGGGRGMRRIDKQDGFLAALTSARSEAKHAFGNGDLILERALDRVRHIEVQIVADTHGQVIHLGERDCSIQRRFQKVIEESPCSVLTPELRTSMGNAAVALAQAINYVGVGTVEFLLAPTGQFYFLEMNTRLQVEHPITEFVTGIDLVEWQLRIAAGEPLPRTQEQIELHGHAIEVRLYAEDPYANYVPQSGPILAWQPAMGRGIRIDHGISAGQEITTFYDPMIAKIIAWGTNREEARRRLLRALKSTAFLGPRSNQAFLQAVLQHPKFMDNDIHTHYLGEHFSLIAHPNPDVYTWAIAAALWVYWHCSHQAPGAWSNSQALPYPLQLRCQEQIQSFTILSSTPNSWRIHLNNQTGEANELLVRLCERDGWQLRLEVDGVQETVYAAKTDHELILGLNTYQFTIERSDFGAQQANMKSAKKLEGPLRAPINGRVVAIYVEENERVEHGQILLTLESMKIESSLTSNGAAMIQQIKVTPGEQVHVGQPLLLFTSLENEP